MTTAEPRTLPANEDVERFILGTILIGGANMPALKVQITSEDFSLDKHKRIFHRLSELHTSGDSVDRVTLANMLKGRGELEAVGGLSYIVSLDDGMPQAHSDQIESWCKILRDKALRRRLIVKATMAIEQAYSGDDELPAILQSTEQALSDINQEQFTEDDMQTPADIIDGYGSFGNFLSPPKGELYITTPWDELNYRLGGGYRPGEVIVYAGRPATGKSTKAMQVAIHNAFRGIETAVYALEMKGRQLLMRSIAARSVVDSMSLRRPHELSREEKQRVHAAGTDFYGLANLHISKRASAHVGSIDAALRRRKAVGRHVRLLVIDYLQLLSSVGKFENRVQQVSAMTRALKIMAMDLDVCVLLLSQLSRDCVKQVRRPELSDLREAGTIEQDADIVEFTHWPKDKEIQEIGSPIRSIENIIGKQREGPIDSIDLAFHTQHLTFHSMDHQEAA